MEKTSGEDSEGGAPFGAGVGLFGAGVGLFGAGVGLFGAGVGLFGAGVGLFVFLLNACALFAPKRAAVEAVVPTPPPPPVGRGLRRMGTSISLVFGTCKYPPAPNKLPVHASCVACEYVNVSLHMGASVAGPDSQLSCA